MEIAKTNNGEFVGISPDSDNCECEINHIEISHERTRQPNEPLAEDDQAAVRSELGKSMWIARIARPGAICDASAAAQTFSDGGLFDISERGGANFGK